MPALRNIAIVAHVDHGKTTLVDHMLRQSGTFRVNEVVPDCVMDSNDLERERGITILAKNTSLVYRDIKINVVDTPGHSDFGGEVERTLMMADGALLLVDAAEGPLPQTRFVLSKCLERGFPVIVVINKIDRGDARPDEVLSEVFDLFVDLGATDAQADFAVIYAVGKLGQAKLSLDAEATNLVPLFETILERVPEPTGDPEAPLQMIICNTTHDDYVGKLAVGRIVNGRLKLNEEVAIVGEGGVIRRANIKQLYVYDGLKRTPKDVVDSGDVAAVAGIDEIHIGDTVGDKLAPVALPRIVVEEPTLKMRLGVNTSPFAGKTKASKFLTSRHIKERLEKEAMKNLAIRIEPTEVPDTFVVLGRGELQLAVLVETMRREGYEVQLGNPEVVTKLIDGVLMEPLERVVVDVPSDHVGVVTERLGSRRGRMEKMQPTGSNRVRLEYVIPSRGLIGFRGEFLTATRGTGLLNTLFGGWAEWGGPMIRRTNGAIVSDRTGTATPYALHHLQARGGFFLSPGAEVYEGMIIGEHNRPSDTDVNAVREKKLSNVRNHGKDENVMLAVPRTLTIETAMEWIDADELVEVTPTHVRVRKRVLECNKRDRRTDAIEDAQGM